MPQNKLEAALELGKNLPQLDDLFKSCRTPKGRKTKLTLGLKERYPQQVIEIVRASYRIPKGAYLERVVSGNAEYYALRSNSNASEMQKYRKRLEQMGCGYWERKSSRFILRPEFRSLVEIMREKGYVGRGS